MPAKPTAKQAKAMQLIREGVRPVAAMRQAGYSKETSQAPKRNLLSTPGAQTIIERYLSAYETAGITPEYLGLKAQEWLTATKLDHSHTEPDKEVPDYQTQLKAAEMVRKDWGLGQPDQVTNNTQNNLFLSDEQLKRIIG